MKKRKKNTAEKDLVKGKGQPLGPAGERTSHRLVEVFIGLVCAVLSFILYLLVETYVL